jgi:hypothetical protein
MKKLFLVVATGLALAACNDSSTDSTGTGGSIDSNYSAPMPDQSTAPDNVHPDSIRTDSSNMNPQGGDGNTSAGKAGAGSSTSSKNSGAAKDDDTNGSK